MTAELKPSNPPEKLRATDRGPKWPVPAKHAEEPRVGNPVPEQAAVAVPTIITDLREACAAGDVGELHGRPSALAQVANEFSSTGLFHRVGYLPAGTTIMLSRQLGDVWAEVSCSRQFQLGGERWRPEFGAAAVTDAKLLTELNSMIDRNADRDLPVLVLMDASVDFQDHAGLAALAKRRKVCVARLVEDETGPTTPEWKPDGR